MPDRVYLDWNATTPLRPEARDAMLAAFELVGNPSSVHAEGRQARRLMEDAREAIAQGIGVIPRNLVFTSGGTEANMLALSPGLRAPAGPVQRLLISGIEHASVMAGGQFDKAAMATIAVTPSGVVDLARLRALLADGPPALVSVMAANNETGALQPVSQVAELVHRHGSLLHVDAIQAFGKISFDLKAFDVDLATISAHKIGGPKGIGALALGLRVVLVRARLPLARAGTRPLRRPGGRGAAFRQRHSSLR